MINIWQLSKSFGEKKVLKDVNLQIKSGEAVALIGPSGSGKTTLIRSLNGFVVPDSGKVLIDGEIVDYKNREKMRQMRKRIGMVYQLFNLVERSSAIANVMTGALGKLDEGTNLMFSSFGIFPKDVRNKALDLLDYVGILDRAHERADHLSGGEKQRVAIARALMQEPEILLADEPIANLDPKTSNKIIELLLKINRERGLTLLIVLHHLETLEDNFDRVVALRDGIICYDGNVYGLDRRNLNYIYKFDREFEEEEEYRECVGQAA